MPIILPQCKDGYTLFKEKCRCRKNKKIKRKKKTVKKKTPKKKTQKKALTKKRCPNGTRKNPKTGLCEPKIKKSKKKTTHIKTIKLTKLYSPSINQKLMSLKTMSPDANIFSCKERQIAVPKKRGSGYKCVSWKSQEAKKMMLRNLNSKKKIKCDNILAPNQMFSNCWFNTFFYVFFYKRFGAKVFQISSRNNDYWYISRWEKSS